MVVPRGRAGDRGGPGREEPEKEAGRNAVGTGEVESLIGQLPGVISCRVRVNDWGAIEEIHVLAALERSPKQLVRDIESSLAARWGIDIDHRKISIAQITGEPEPLPVRLILDHVQVHTEVGKSSVEVRVRLVLTGDRETSFEGHASGPYSRQHLLNLAAEATVRALNSTLRTGYLLALDGATVIPGAAGRQVAVVQVSLLTPRGDEEVLSGACVVAYDQAEAVVRATLDATNRRMGRVFNYAGKRRG